jgi:hypothetical protein
LFDDLLIRFLDDGGVIQIAFSLLALLGQNVAMVGMLPFDFAGARQFKTFFGSGLGLHFWHLTILFLTVKNE